MLKNYLINPDLLLNVLYVAVFLFIAYKVLGVTLWANVKKKLNPWEQNEEKDFDRLIKRKIDMLRANSGMYVPENENLSSQLIRKTKKAETLDQKNIPIQFKEFYEDLSWGGGTEIKKVLKLFQREFNYSPNENSARDFFKKAIKENTIFDLINHSAKDEIIHLFYNRMLLNYFLQEISDQKFNLIKKISQRLNIETDLFAFSVQVALLKNHNLCFSNKLVWSQISDNEKANLIENFLQKNSDQINKSVNSLIEIIRSNFTLADFIRPWNEITKESSLEDALLILRSHQNFSLDDIKKNYKKIVQEKHPDKIAALKLPKEIESNALRQFQIIQAAMDLVQKHKGRQNV